MKKNALLLSELLRLKKYIYNDSMPLMSFLKEYNDEQNKSVEANLSLYVFVADDLLLQSSETSMYLS